VEAPAHGRPVTVEVSFHFGDLRGAAVVLLGGGVLLPLLPGHAGLPCPLRTLTGVPCPLCGMTTSVEATLHAHPLAAVDANPAGPFLVATAVALLIRRPARAVQIPLVVVVLALAVLWLFELHRFSIL
jgi:Protein of unknown function (DUF2752)